MAFVKKGTEKLPENYKDLEDYYFHEYHRERRISKSTWLIDYKIEFDVFNDALLKKFEDSKGNFYNFYKKEELKPLIVGKDIHTEEIKLCKFKTSNPVHGYPVNYMNKSYDIPSDEVLEKLKKEKYISKASFNKIKRGKPLWNQKTD